MLNKSENQILNPHFRKLHFSNLQPFRGIVNGTSQKKQPFQGRRISRMPKTTWENTPKFGIKQSNISLIYPRFFLWLPLRLQESLWIPSKHGMPADPSCPRWWTHWISHPSASTTWLCVLSTGMAQTKGYRNKNTAKGPQGQQTSWLRHENFVGRALPAQK